jgi:uncharacterized protein (TIGR02391 family)
MARMPDTLRTLYPDLQDLLDTPPEDLAPVLLKVARDTLQNGMFLPQTVNDQLTGNTVLAAIQQPVYSFHERYRISPLLSEVWGWIEQHGLIAPAADINGRNGWKIFTRKGEQAAADPAALRRMQAAAQFPKSLIHPAIADKVWRALMRDDLADAVFVAFRAVEEAVRDAGGFAPTDIGVPLMRKAFDKNTGPLSDLSHPEPEREALAHLFAGAIGSYKNPHSHRTVTLAELRDAQEQIVLASHLLRIVDSRRRPPAAG